MIKPYIFSRNKNSTLLKVLQLSHECKKIRIVSAVGSRSQVDSVGAMLRARDRGAAVDDSLDDQEERMDSVVYCDELKSNPGFKTWTVLLGLDCWHLLAISKDESLMPRSSPAHLWHILRQDRFTTPIVKEWLPYIYHECRRREYLRPFGGFGPSSDLGAALVMTDENLDQIVTDGLRSGSISIPERVRG